jgi:hypothetical protein
MIVPLLGVLGCWILMSDDGVPAAGIVLLWPPVGLPTFVRFMYEQKTEMERLVALVQELGVSQLSYHILRVCLAVLRLIHIARTTPPELLEDLIDDFDTTLVLSGSTLHRVRVTLADSNTVLLAYYESLRLFSCSYFALVSPWAVAQPNSLARRSHPLICGLPRLRRGRGRI